MVVRNGSPGAPGKTPIGLQVARTSKALDRAFDKALASAGGNRPMWLVLLSIMSGSARTQSDLAERVGVRGPTLTHHLDNLERRGLVIRERDASNRRVQRVQLTAAGAAMFHRLREAAVAFDRQARTGIPDDQVDELRRLLIRMQDNVQPTMDQDRVDGSERSDI